MATIFTSKPGTAILLKTEDGDQGLPLVIDGIQGSWFPAYKSILTGVSVGLDGNYQFTHTLKNVLYIYTFGDRISLLQVSGLAFQETCGNATNGTGIEAVLAFYDQNRIAVRARPIQIAIGTQAAGRFRGYLTHFKPEIFKPEARLASFTMTFHVIPQGT